MEEATAELNRAIAGADVLLKHHSIESIATYDTVPLEEEIGITSALGHRYFELIHKLDLVMPLLQTLEIEEVISEKEVEKQRSGHKRIVLAMASTARNSSMGVRRRMNEADAKKGEVDDRRGRVSDEKSPVDGSGAVATLDTEELPRGQRPRSTNGSSGNSRPVFLERRSHVVETLARDLKVAFPDNTGFSKVNLWRMRQFHASYTSKEFLSHVVREMQRTGQHRRRVAAKQRRTRSGAILAWAEGG